MELLEPLMLVGTGSDVGKSILAAAFCRIFRQDGYQPAPFKAQNMALNSYATPEGLEIGRAQAVQAEAAGIPCHTDMNPLLLKPQSDHTSQVVLNGRPVGNRSAYDYFRKEGREELRKEVCSAYDRLAARYNPIVLEGAGSISEINLRDSDLVNLPMALHAGAWWATLTGAECLPVFTVHLCCSDRTNELALRESLSINSEAICVCSSRA